MIAKFRKYRDTIASDGVKPLSFTEWILGRVAGWLEVRTAVMAQKRGDNVSLNHTLLTVWIGNQSNGGRLAAALSPRELSSAIKEGRLRLVLEP